ncbi:hypothetical protein GCM10009830_21000 [Glycomyces endophyticus]|uniref:Secreted protein n=1 Tax=Glycomyces endophyticus TaxID=480996 RepID=A0ABP4SLZ3_9ACTN
MPASGAAAAGPAVSAVAAATAAPVAASPVVILRAADIFVSFVRVWLRRTAIGHVQRPVRDATRVSLRIQGRVGPSSPNPLSEGWARLQRWQTCCTENSMN